MKQCAKNLIKFNKKNHENLPDSDNSTFLGLGAGEGDSLFSVPLCFVTKNKKKKKKKPHIFIHRKAEQNNKQNHTRPCLNGTTGVTMLIS